jgi:hypothetical protein
VRALVLALVVSGCAAEGRAISEWSHDGARMTLPSADGTAFVLTADVPLAETERGQPLTLVVDLHPRPVELTVDGIAVPDISYGVWPQSAFAIAPQLTNRPALQLRMTGEGPIGKVPRLVLGVTRSTPTVAFNRIGNTVTLVMALVFALLYAILFAFDRRRKEYAAFVVQNVAVIFMPAMGLGLLIDRHLVWLLGLVAQLATVLFLHLAFELGRVPRVLFGAYAVMAVFGVLGPELLMIGLPGTSLVLATELYLVARYVALARRREYRVDASVLAVSYALFVVFNCLELAIGLRRIDINGLDLTVFALGQAVLVQALVLAHQYTVRQRAAERSQLELQRQVAERSKELADALGKLAKQPRPLDDAQVIDSRYRVLRRLGAGGMGSVHEVERISDGQRLALKTLRGRSDPETMARFAREAQIAAELSHPNLVPVIDVGISDGGLFLVMPLVDGGSLEHARERFGDAKWARPLLAQIATGLVALHERGIVHRDLKPGNVLVTNGVARIADFGLAALRTTSETASIDDGLGATITGALGRAPLTRAGDVFGTPMYMAPELADGAREAGAASDLFAFGVIAYEMLTGRRPFAESPVVSKLERRAIAAPACDGIDPTIARCLALDPAARPTASEVLPAWPSKAIPGRMWSSR